VDYTRAYLTGECEASLKRLKRECIEYYQLHTARLSHLQEGECVETMKRLQQQGKIRYWGLSLNTFNPLPEAEWLMERKLGFGFQAVLNIINQRALPLLKPAAQGGYGIIARMALQFGLLTGKFSTASSFQANDHRKGRLTPDLIRYSDLALSPVWDLCEKYNCSKTALSLSYVLSHPEVSTVIPGIRTREQVIDNTSHIFTVESEDLVLIESTLKSSMTGLMQEIENSVKVPLVFLPLPPHSIYPLNRFSVAKSPLHSIHKTYTCCMPFY